eukprot:10545953-Prorocentrum_lima.AAC.1
MHCRPLQGPLAPSSDFAVPLQATHHGECAGPTMLTNSAFVPPWPSIGVRVDTLTNWRSACAPL